MQNKDQMDKYCLEKVRRCHIAPEMHAIQGFIGWFETSAKDNTGISDAAEALVRSILKSQGVRHCAIGRMSCSTDRGAGREAGCEPGGRQLHQERRRVLLGRAFPALHATPEQTVKHHIRSVRSTSSRRTFGCTNCPAVCK